MPIPTPAHVPDAKVPPPPAWDAVAFFMDYESGNVTEEAIIDGFQRLIDSGLAWSLQGHYGRVAAQLIKAGYCTP